MLFSLKNPSSKGAFWPWALIGLLGAALGWGAAALATIKAGGFPLGAWPEAWRYHDTNLPMISSADGFYFLHQAELALKNGSGHIAPFSRLTALAATITGQPVEAVAFYMSLFFHFGLGLLAAAWARRLGAGKSAAFLAAIAAAVMPAWLERGGPGNFDTDLPILLFWQLGLFFLKISDDLKPARRGDKNLCFAIVSFYLLHCLWLGGLGLAVASVLVWLFFFVPLRVFPLKARIVSGLAAAIWVAAIVALPQHKAPAPDSVINLVHDYSTLAFRARPELFYSSIKELDSLGFVKLMEKIGGGVPGGLTFLALGLLAAWRLPCLRLPLFLGLGCILAGVRSNRFVYLGLYPLALSAGLLPHLMAEAAPRGRLRPALGSAGLLIWAALMFSCLNWAAHRDLDIRWERGHDRLAEALRQTGESGDAFLWNWWDDGYFLAARSDGMRQLFDGGSQTHTMAYIAAHPFMMEDHRAAARWMRFFAIRGEAGLAPLAAVWGAEGAWRKLDDFFRADDPSTSLAADLKKIKGGLNWLFPEGKVYWYMPSYFFKISNWWVPLGLSPTPDIALVRPHLETIGRDKFRYDSAEKTLTVTKDLWERGYQSFGLVFQTEQNPLAPPWPTGGAPYLVYSERSAKAYIADQLGLRSLPLYMLAPGGETPEKFRPLIVEENWGGVWEVLP